MTTRTKKLADPLLEADNSHLRTAAKRTYSRVDQETVDERITRFIPLVHKIAKRVSVYLKPPLNYEDLVSAGTMGLLKAARDFDSAFQTEFITYAFIKIKGAILDELRAWSFVPAGVEKQIQKVMDASSEFLDKTGRNPSDEELAGELDISVKKLYDVYEGARARNFVSIDEDHQSGFSFSDFLSDTNAQSPESLLVKGELVESLTTAIQELGEKQRHIVLLYYQQNLTMRQIAEVMDITEARVSQLHANAIFNLSLKLKNWNKDE